jgi:SOS-response transcriptional repressor LexA
MVSTTTMEIKTLRTLSERLHFAMEKEGISQAALARAVDIKPAALQYLLSSNAQASRFTFELAHALNVRPEWLATGNGPVAIEEDPLYRAIAKYRPIPVLNIEDVTQWKEFNKIKWHDDFIMIEKFHGENTFAFRIADAAMKPVFNKGNIVIVATDKPPSDGDLVIGMIASQNEVMFRKLSLGHEALFLPYNLELYKPITMTTEDTILGVAIEVKVMLNA